MEIKSDHNNKPFFSVGVTDLVFFTKKSGDLNIDTSTYGRQRLVDGIRLHLKIQNNRGEHYQSEVFLSKIIEFDEFILEIKGRADGINIKAKPIVIEEIKSHSCDYKDIEKAQKSMHWSQVYFYAYMLSDEYSESKNFDLHLTYVHVDTEREKTEKRIFKKDEIKFICKDLLEKFRSFISYKIKREKERNKKLISQQFPLKNFRKGQRDLAAAVYSVIKREEKLFIEAPTGMGKTIGSLFPALKAIGEGLMNQIFFLTAKGTGKESAVKAMQLMNKDNDALNSLVLTSKSKICFNTDKACDPEECIYARSYFNKIDQATNKIHGKYQIKGQEEIEEIAKMFEICPFEFSLDLIMSSDVVICDYNYTYDPRVHLKRIFSEENKDVVILADETHNLVSRARDMHSSDIDENEIAEAKKKWSSESPELKKAYNRVLRYFRKLRKELEESNEAFLKIPEGPVDLCWSLKELMYTIEKFNKLNPKFIQKKELTDDYFYCLETVRIWELYGSGHTTVVNKSGKKINVKLLCLDASEAVSRTTDLVRSAIFFSGTLTPIDFYTKSLFGDRKLFFKRFLSPFPKEYVKVVAVTHISTKYKDRDSSLHELCQSILTVIKGKTGNYMVFCPSFAYLKQIKEDLETMVSSDTKIISQVPEMLQEERDLFLDWYNYNNQKTLVGLVVSGGVFGEGIDLVAEKLIGAIIVGVGLPGINEETDAVKEYYQEKYQMGFEFAYQYPGINKVLQNSGRVIRTETDKGIICFIGKRYLRSDYKQFMPHHWDISYVNNISLLKEEIEKFRKMY